jgi:hypothetical protein
MKPKSTNGPLAVLILPKLDWLILALAKLVLLSLTGNAYFPNPWITLAAFSADIIAYDKAMTAAKGKGTGLAAAKNAKKQKVVEDLKHLCDYVQSVIELQTSVADAIAMILSSGFQVRKVPVRVKAAVAAKNGQTAGTAVISAKSLGPKVTYYWQFSIDSKSWSNWPETMKATTVISGLTSSTVYYFRFRALTPKGPVDYSQIVSLLVH